MKSKLYNKQIVLGTFIVFVIHFTLFFAGIFHLTLKSMLSTDGFLFILFFLGTLIISPYLDKEPEKIVIRVVRLTIVQLIAAIFTVILFNVTKIHNTTAVSYHLIVVFLSLLILQTFLLVKRIRS
jgi:hypothetical protein